MFWFYNNLYRLNRIIHFSVLDCAYINEVSSKYRSSERPTQSPPPHATALLPLSNPGIGLHGMDHAQPSMGPKQPLAVGSRRVSL